VLTAGVLTEGTLPAGVLTEGVLTEGTVSALLTADSSPSAGSTTIESSAPDRTVRRGPLEIHHLPCAARGTVRAVFTPPALALRDGERDPAPMNLYAFRRVPP
jgi:hypothetical protein